MKFYQQPTRMEGYLAAVSSLGFKEVLEVPFTANGRDEKLIVLFHPQNAILLSFDTKESQKMMNGGRFSYNWHRRCTEREVGERHLTNGGRWARDTGQEVFVGYHVVPNFDIHRVIGRLSANGYFVSPWVESQSINLTHYGDYLKGQRLAPGHEERAHRRLVDERVAMLPVNVRRALLL